MLNHNYKKNENPTFEIEIRGGDGYYKYKKTFTQLEYGISLSPVFRSGIIWFYIIFSVYFEFLLIQFLNTFTKGIKGKIPIFLSNTMIDINQVKILVIVGTLVLELITLFLAYFLYNKFKKISIFLISISIFSNLVLFIGIFKTLSIFK